MRKRRLFIDVVGDDERSPLYSLFDMEKKLSRHLGRKGWQVTAVGVLHMDMDDGREGVEDE